MQITLEIKDTVLDKFLWMLENFKNDVTIAEKESENIDIHGYLEIKENIAKGDLSEFKAIDDVDEHIKELLDATR